MLLKPRNENFNLEFSYEVYEIFNHLTTPIAQDEEIN